MAALFRGFDTESLDAHCHLQHDAAFLSYARKNPGRGFFCMTEAPEEYEKFLHESFPANATLGLGLHPWSVAADVEAARQQAARVVDLLPSAWLVGEVGLDFSVSHAASKEAQLQAFEAIASACAQVGGKALSIHAVQAAGEALDILEKTKCLASCDCIFHWFSGTGDQLIRARNAGCYFSFGPRALNTKRGRAYASQIPAERLLRETDSFNLT